MPPVPGDVRFANSLANALSASDLLHELRGAGGLTSTAYIVGEHDPDEVDVLRAAVATAEAALQKKIKTTMSQSLGELFHIVSLPIYTHAKTKRVKI